MNFSLHKVQNKKCKLLGNLGVTEKGCNRAFNQMFFLRSFLMKKKMIRIDQNILVESEIDLRLCNTNVNIDQVIH